MKIKLKIPIRYKMLLTFLVVLLLAIGTYLYLATSLFTEDKLAYIYDLNSSLVETLSEQTRSNLEVLTDKLSLFTRDVLEPGLSDEDRAKVARELFAEDRDILRIEVFKPDGTGEFQRVHGFVNTALLDEVGLDAAALQHMRKEHPVPLEAVADKGARFYLQNSSLPPDSAVLTVLIPHRGEAGSFVVAADFSHERLLRIFGKSKLHETYLVDDAGEVLAHPDAKKVIESSDMSGHALVREALGADLEQGVREFTAEDGRVMLGAYAKVGIGRLSVLTQISKRDALRANSELIKRSIYFAVGILLAAFMVSVIFSRLLTAPIGRLSAASEVIGQGNFDINIDVKSRDEIGDLARSFEQMAGALKETQTQLVFSEKMAAFGQLGAGITHEVKNPIAGIVGFAQLGQMEIDEKDKIQEYLTLIEIEGKRCSDMLVNFLKFVRQDTDELKVLDMNSLVQEVGKIINHQLMINNVGLKLELGEGVPPVLGNAAKLQQVILNLAINAQQAMPNGGVFTDATGADGDGWATMTITDNGPGIPEDIRGEIFNPFFTTKPPGEGTGLGLSIVFRIIDDHDGSIAVDSKVGEGTSFVIRLPRHTAA